MGTLEAIERCGLATRQIPREVISLYAMRHHLPGNKVVEEETKSLNFGPWLAKHGGDAEFMRNYRIDHETKKIFRLYTQSVRVPEFAGYWMVQPSSSMGSRMDWNLKEHFLAPTLAESVSLFLASIGA